jgi:ABC-type transporter Mla subunit MlaD
MQQNKGLWLGAALLVIIGGLLFWILTGPEPFRLVILYDETGDLKKGDAVMWRDFNIGKVEEVNPLVDNQVGVTIRIKKDYAGRLTQGTEFVLKRAAFLGLVGQNAIEVVTPGSPGAPLASGARIQGKMTPKSSLIEEGTKVTLEYWQQLKDQTSLAIEEFRSSPHGREIEEALDELKSIAERGTQQTKERAEQFRKDHQKEIDEALQKLARIRDELRKRGDLAAVRRLEEQIEKLTR